jgi:hypothetical protein
MKSKKSISQPITREVKRGRGRPRKTPVVCPPTKKAKPNFKRILKTPKIDCDVRDIDFDIEYDNPKIAKPRRSVSHYVDNKRFEQLIREYYKTDVFSEELGEMINKISEHVTYMPRFVNYTYHPSMISDSNYKMVKALNERKFDPDKGSAFSYFTKICIHAFFFITEKERKNHTTIENYQNELYDELTLHGYINNAVDNENHYE